MDAHFQLISDGDLNRTIELMREFYAATEMRFDEEVARTALRKTLLDPSLGSVYVVTVEKATIGYFVLTYCFSLEFHGKFALLDEIYVREAHRRQKIGEAIIGFCENICRKMGIRALRLETAHDNEIAHNLYRKTGFAQEMRHLFTKWVGPATNGPS